MNWTESLLSDIVAMRGKEMPSITAEAISSFFAKIGESNSRIIVHRLEGIDNIPSNIMGWIKKEYALMNAADREREEWKIRHNDGLGNNHELIALTDFLTEVTEWHKLGIAESKPIRAIFDIDFYIDACKRGEKPVTWSPIVDHWLVGFSVAYVRDLSEPGFLLDYLLRYNEMLKKQKTERIAALNGRSTKAREEQLIEA